MKDPRKIRRFAYELANSTAAAGVYTTSTSRAATPRFNVELIGVSFGVYAIDTITFQSIPLNCVVTCPFPAPSDNPALPGFNDYARISASSRTMSRLRLYYQWSAGQLITFGLTYNLDTVTANAVAVVGLLSLEYLCPEDYLSFDAFAATPK